MTALLATARVAFEMAFRNLFASRWKTLIVGGIIGVGALLVVIGVSLVDDVDRGMRRSIVGSIAGHIQVYSSESTDDLEILGNAYVDVPDIAPLDDFAKVKRTLLAVPHVRAVVPMGFSDALASTSSALDEALDALRETVSGRDRGKTYVTQKLHVQQVISVLKQEAHDAAKLSERSYSPDELRALDRATSAQFWDEFDSDPGGHLEYLDNHIAALAEDEDIVVLRYVGTDPAAFAKAFDRMRIVDGQAIPEGERGLLFSKLVYEEGVKLRAARGLDHIKAGIEEMHERIADDPELQRIVRENVSGVSELLVQLDAQKLASFREKLQRFLHESESDVGKLLARFFATTDQNFKERYAFFYRALAPELRLYRVRVGDTITIKTVTRSGYLQAANVKVWGTYVFDGLEKSPQAGAINMVDLVTFRDLYGFITPDREREVAALRAAAGAVDVSREDAEAELFGSKANADTAVALDASSGKPASDPLAKLRGTRARAERAESHYNPKQLEQGPVLDAAVILDDESNIDATIAAITAAGKRAGLPLKAVSWQKAAGLIGQFTTLMRAILFAAVLIIFAVGLVVINNALVMATLERVNELGTLRAIGAQRRFILAMLIIESLVIGVVSGTLGGALGALVLVVLGKTGIPAQTDVMTFFFSGPRLFPTVGLQELGFALVTVIVVSLISGIYPAWLAMRVSPREAMHAEE